MVAMFLPLMSTYLPPVSRDGTFESVGRTTRKTMRGKRPRTYFSPSNSGAEASPDWEGKINPWFLAIAEQNRKVLEGKMRDFPPEQYVLARSLGGHIDCSGGFEFTFLKVMGFDDLPPGSEISFDEFLLRYLCWLKYGTPLPELIRQRHSGSWSASQKLLRVQRLYEKVVFGKVNLNDQRALAKRSHLTMMRVGLHFGLNILSERELSAFYDTYCPLCKKHSPENLKKLRGRARAVGRQAVNTHGEVRPPEAAQRSDYCKPRV